MMECMLDFLFWWVRPGVPNLWDLMADDLSRAGVIIIEIKCTIYIYA